MSFSQNSRLQQAHQLNRAGRYDEAISAYQAVLAAQPALPDIWYELAWLLKLRGQFDPALEAYAQALKHGVSGAEEVHLNRAVIYTDGLHDHSAAEDALQAALALNPDYVPARLNLGNLCEEQGRRGDAQDCYEAILANAPQPDPHADLRLEALARLALLRDPESAADPLLQRLQASAGSAAAMDDSVRANLYFALGRSLETLALFDRAFAAFQQANRYAGRGGPAYQPEQMRRRVDALIAASPAAAPRTPSDDHADTLQPLFICGMFRSGSTLIEQVLSAHSQIAAGGELDFFPRLVAGPLAPFPASLAKLDSASAQALADQYRAHLRRIVPADRAQARWFSDKRPDNFQLIGLIKRLFPGAKIIHTTRDPLDNGLSIYLQHLNQRAVPHASDLSAIGHHYAEYRRLMAHWQKIYPGDFYDFSYDDFVRDPEPQLRGLLRFLGLDWEPDCLAFHQRKTTVKTASYWQVRQPLYRDASGRWRNYQAHLQPLQAALRRAGVLQD